MWSRWWGGGEVIIVGVGPLSLFYIIEDVGARERLFLGMQTKEWLIFSVVSDIMCQKDTRFSWQLRES
jgi:hypothetical protein